MWQRAPPMAIPCAAGRSSKPMVAVGEGIRQDADAFVWHDTFGRRTRRFGRILGWSPGWHVTRAALPLVLAVSLQAQVQFDRIRHSDSEPQNWLTYSGNYAAHR